MADDKLRAFGEARVRGSNDATSPDGLRVSTPCGVRAGANNAGGGQFLGCEFAVGGCHRVADESLNSTEADGVLSNRQAARRKVDSVRCLMRDPLVKRMLESPEARSQ